MLLPVEHDVAANPVDVRIFGPRAVMSRPNRMPHLIEELRPGSNRSKRDDVRCLLRIGWVCHARLPANSVPLDHDVKIEGIVDHVVQALLFRQ